MTVETTCQDLQARRAEEHSRCFHDDRDSHRLDSFFDRQGDLPRKPFLHLKTAREGFCNPSELGET